MLIDNTLFLRERFPEIREYFREYEKEIESERITVLDSKTRVKTIRYESEDNKHFMVHSMYDPMKEAERIISSHKGKITEDTHVFFYGIGMGYHIELFHELFPDNSYSLYEPISEIFLAMTEVRKLEYLVTKKAQNLYIDTHIAIYNDYLEEFYTSNKKIHIIYLPSYENLIKGKIISFNQRVKDAVQSRRISLSTKTSFQKLWVMNSLLNFKEVLNTPNMLRDIDRKQFAGKPAVIVSAGPSLAEDIEHLRYIKDNNLAYLFAVGSAINSLIEYDVFPDAVCTYDPGSNNHQVYKKMIDKKIDTIPMLFGSSVGYETIKNYDGPKVHFITSQDRTSTYFLKEQLDVEQDLIIDSPSIAVMTFQVLNKLGASPIVFAGQNLGYLHDRRYSEGINYDFIKSEVSEQEMEKAITTKDVYGNDIKTNIGFNSMRVGLESFAKLYNGNYINTTKGGALIEGVPFKPIENVIEEILTKPIEKINWWKAQNDYDYSVIETQRESLKKSNNQYQDLMRQLKKVIHSISNHTKSRSKSNVSISLTQFDGLYNKLLDNSYYQNFLSFYIRVYVEFLGNEIRRLNREPDMFVKGEEIVRLFSNFMRECEQESLELEKLISSSLEEVISK
ncbi:motility associated factor glycosyltransferase family protein [Oceanobacillus chungangensis]|uniref:6-hydroxymethylpterin diphosphokinase MptE-like domain-containing protein n=1 Tax=Oceanobacillus chungangensis TaxID=1229152 RepID=A0A3D8PX90_9BACI|nr:6-hydroxymethylpterin diphosphokinase MptE-like protein [Oceanobacillus chungangensis]RDW20770.1 hypothetical protein CWR45_05975 [Oceanobacillus chungangensis]